MAETSWSGPGNMHTLVSVLWCSLWCSTAKTYERNRLDKMSIVDRHRCHMAAKFGLFVDEDIASFLRYTGYLNFINGPISRVLLLILEQVQLLSCLLF